MSSCDYFAQIASNKFLDWFIAYCSTRSSEDLITGVQITELQLKKPNLSQPRILEIVFLVFRGSDCQGKKILERKASVSNRETLEQSYWHSNFPLSLFCQTLKHIPSVCKLLTAFS